MAFRLTDDGTMDTVVRCEHCSEEVRFNYAMEDAGEPECTHGKSDGCQDCYDEWVEQCCVDAEDDHECGQAVAS